MSALVAAPKRSARKALVGSAAEGCAPTVTWPPGATATSTGGRGAQASLAGAAGASDAVRLTRTSATASASWSRRRWSTRPSRLDNAWVRGAPVVEYAMRLPTAAMAAACAPYVTGGVDFGNRVVNEVGARAGGCVDW